MMRFTIGVAMLAFTLIVGSYQYFDNEDIIVARQNSVQEAIDKREKYKRIQARTTQLPQMSISKGDDQKNTIERLLDIGRPGLSFSFIGQPRVDPLTPVIIRHTFRIEGPSTFMNMLKVMQQMHTLPGFVVYKVCYACNNTNDNMLPGEEMITVEGYLYVYDAALI